VQQYLNYNSKETKEHKDFRMLNQKLSAKVIEKLGYYVDLYKNPLDDSIFYVGKGHDNRVFTHLNDKTESRKIKTIESIRTRRKEPIIENLVHGLPDEITALRIEAAVIDQLGVKSLTNQVRGWESNIVGRMGIYQLVALYDSKPIKIIEPAILIRVNQLYRYGMTDQELYDITRGVWKLRDRREKATYAFAVYKGIVREVYRICKWYPAGTFRYRTRSLKDVKAPGRWEFEGELANMKLRQKYIDRSVADYFKTNSQNPVTYVGC
jgi:hypothetical protein